MIREIYPSGFNSFVTPFMLGMTFVLGWCLIGACRVLLELPREDRKKLAMSFFNPKIMAKNIRDWFCDCLFHVKLWKRNKLLGFMHSSIAFGWFMIIVIGHIEVFLYTPERIHRMWYPIFFRYFVAVSDTTMEGALLFFLMDLFLLIVLTGIILAIIKRVHSRLFGMRRTTRGSLTDLIGLYALWCIFPLRLLAEGFTADISGGSFLTKSLNNLLHLFYIDPTNALPVWWAYSIALGVFMCVLPFSRYMHIPAEILLIPMRNAGIPIRHSRKGISRLQVHSCPGCGVCIDACPLSTVPANVRDTTVYLNRQLKRNNRRRIEEISDKCLLCGKCSAVCPVGVEGDKLRIAQRGTRKYNISADYSMIDESAFVKDKDRRVLYFAGCMTHLTPSIKRSLTSILETAGEDYSLMDEDGGICCGRPMLTAGRKDAAMQMIEKNTEIIRSSGASVLLLSCPICYRIFKQDYRLEGIEVLHHSEYIDRLISEKKLDISRTDLRYAYHDPCELGRGCGIYEEPRNVVSAAGVLVEGAKKEKESICCGGSLGSLTLSDEQRKRLAENALGNLTADSPDAVVTACPLCKNTFNRYAAVPVLDIAEIVAQASGRNNIKNNTMDFIPTKYSLVCCADGHRFEDTGWCLADPQCGCPSLVRTEYEKKQYEPREDLDGFYRYANWLPIQRTLNGSGTPVTYRSTGLAAELGLENLYITFSGLWPEKGAKMTTCSFKETEAYSVCGRLSADNRKILVVASAGNTARAFAKVCSENNIPLLISIPADNIGAMWFSKPLNDCVKIIASPEGSDYYDAIALSDKVCTDPAFMAEGGAKNVARRDGMGTTLLSAVEVIGRIPDAYFQAIGSGTGAIAVWENNLRLIEDGRWGSHKMRLYPSQNDPFTIMYDSWKLHSRQLVDMSPDDARKAAAEIDAKVLSNRKPPYSLAGGLFDSMEDAGGDMFKVTNEELRFWKKRFAELEGIDIHDAPAVAVASLAAAVKEGAVKKDETIMLNITGGGEELAKSQQEIFHAKPHLILDPALPAEEIINSVKALF